MTKAQEAKRLYGFLPERQALVVYLALVEGLTNDEIAEELGISPAAVSRHLAQAGAAVGARTARQGLSRIALLSLLSPN